MLMVFTKSLGLDSNTFPVISTIMVFKRRENGGACAVFPSLPVCFLTPALAGIKLTAEITMLLLTGRS
jgi:hypothetical protein